MADFSQPINQKWFVVAIMDTHREYTFFMSSGMRESSRSNRKIYDYTRDRSKAQRFSKLAAEDLCVILRKDFRRIAKVEEQ